MTLSKAQEQELSEIASHAEYVAGLIRQDDGRPDQFQTAIRRMRSQPAPDRHLQTIEKQLEDIADAIRHYLHIHAASSATPAKSAPGAQP
jgi:hypothetical protein